MKNSIYFLAVISIYAGLSVADSVTDEGSSVLLLHGKEIRRLPLPTELQKALAYQVRVTFPPRASEGNSGGSSGGGGAGGSGSGGGSGSSPANLATNPPATTPSVPPAPEKKALEKSKLSTLLLQANRLFNKKKYEQALDLLDRAEDIAPDSFKVQTMKGSLFYKMGWFDTAREHWEKSLELNPKQPQVKRLIDRLKPAEKTSGE